MAIINLNLGLDDNQNKIIEEILKYTFMLSVINMLMSSNYSGKAPINFGLTKGLFNSDFLFLILSIMISVMAYYLIFKELITIN